MTITVSSTSKLVELNGVPARIWEGKTESGVEVHCYIVRIAAHKDANLMQFERELQETQSPSAAVEAIPLRMIL